MNRDIASDLGVVLAFYNNISTNTITNGSGIDTAHYDGGVMFFISDDVWADGTFAVKLQDSPDNSVWTDVPANKLILPSGSLPSISAGSSVLDPLPRIGAFSTDKWIRVVVTSTGVTTGAIINAFAVELGEIRPVA